MTVIQQNRLVTICIPTYNSGKTIERTLKSILDQTYNNVSIHIIDNVSTDNTVSIAESFLDPRIIIHKQSVHTEDGEDNWNRCFEYMGGDYAGIFHSDDVYEPTMIEKQVDILDRNSDVCAVFVNASFIDETDKIIGNIDLPEDYKDNAKLTARSVLIAVLRNGNTLVCPSPLFRTGTFKYILAPFRHNQFTYSSDLDMWIRAAELSHIVVIDEQLIRYRQSSSQGSAKIHHLRTSEEAFFYTVDYHLKKYKDLPQDAVDKYELRRVQDKLHCVINCINKLGLRLPRLLVWGLMKCLNKRV